MYNDIEAIKTVADNNLNLANTNVDTRAFDYKDTNAEVETMELDTTAASYQDVSDKTQEAANYVTEKGYMLGTSEENFNPDGKITRAYMTQVLYNMAGRPDVTPNSSYSDVTNTAWYSKAVTWATESGIATGNSDGTFNPSEELTNEQVLSMLRQYGTYRNLDTNAYANLETRKYPDISSVSDGAMDTYSWAVDNWIYSGDTLNPKGK